MRRRYCLPFLLLAAWRAPLFPQEVESPDSAKDATVWALDDTDKVHPITGNLLSEGEEIYNGLKPSKANYRNHNSVWDGSTRTIKLMAGRNEFVGFQIVIEKGREDLHKIFVNATDLLGSNGRISADSNVRLFKQLYVPGGGSWCPDALVPFEIAGVTPLELPDYAGPIRGQRVQPVWVDIYVPHDRAPGTYTGQFIILHRNTNRQAILHVELRVGDFTLPDKLGLDIDLMNYGFLNIERGWPDLVQDSPRHRSIEREFFRMAHAHRTTFAVVPYNHDGSIPKGQKPELAGVGEGIRVSDWNSWDGRYGPMLSGDAFADLPRGREPVAHFFLPHNLMWPSDMRNWKTPTYRTENLRISEAIRRHFAEKGWTRTLYEVYYNHKEYYGFYPWNLDEPTREKDLDALAYLGSILNEAFPANDGVQVAYRLDIGHYHCENVRDCKNTKDTSRAVTAALDPYIRLWNISANHYFANMTYIGKLKSRGKVVYFYGSTPRVAAPLADALLWGWEGYKYEADGVCVWNATDWGDWDTDEPPADPYTNAGGRYAGASMLFYPGSKFGYDGPIPSIRLKAMRRGLQDFEYLRLIEKSGKKSRPELVALSEGFLGDQNSGYAKLRGTVYGLLSGR
jgi:hypothetical protein